MKPTDSNSIPKTAFVLFNNGAFGGAEKRFSSLFYYLNAKYPGKFYFFINNHFLDHINRIYADFPKKDIRIVDFELPVPNAGNVKNPQTIIPVSNPRIYRDIIPDPIEVDRETWFPRKLYWFQKNKMRQRKLFNIIEEYRKELGIGVFIGIYSGILPLVFYMKQKPRTSAIIFSDMDSWFTEVHPDMKKLWYRKYYSFNYALENADYVDFLSPFIYEGVKARNVNVPAENASITACSFVDYSKCSNGPKLNFAIAFSARLEPDKNPMLYLEAAREILGEFPDIKFYILGEGSLVNEVNNFIETNGLKDKIVFQFHNNPPEIFSGTSIFVSLQTGTNYPSQSVIEAMACGNAVIASDVGDTRLLVNESNGLLIGPGKTELVNAMKKLIGDAALCKSLGAAGREFVMKDHTIEKASEYYIDLICKAPKKVFIS